MTIVLTAIATLISAGAVLTWLQQGAALPYGPGSTALALWVSTIAGVAWAVVYLYA